MLKNSEF